MKALLDPYGKAAFLLCQGTLLLFVEKGLLQKDDVASMLEGLIETGQDELDGQRDSAASLMIVRLLRETLVSLSVA